MSESVYGATAKQPNSVKPEGMAERQHTIVCAFDQRIPRVSAFDIHEWIYETLQLQTNEVCMIQIDGKGDTFTLNSRTHNKCTTY